MGIKFKAITIILLSFLILLVGEHVITNKFFMHNVLVQEKNAVHLENNRSEYMINQYKVNLVSSVKDYAYWDDTYNFMKGMDAEYINTNFTKETMENLKIALVAFYDKNNQLQYIVGYDSPSGNKFEISNITKSELKKISPKVCYHKTLESTFSGIIKLDTGAMIIASASITDTRLVQTDGGTLLFGKYLDTNVINSIEKITNSHVEIVDINGRGSKGEKVLSDNLKQMVLNACGTYIIPLDNKKVIGYSVIKGLNREPLFFLENEMERTIFKSGKKSIYFFEFMLICIIATITVIIIILLQNTIICPIVRLSKSLININLENIKLNRVPIKKKDEISVLSNEINGMLIKIQEKKEVEKELTYLSYYDKLTGLFNRGYFEYQLDKKIQNKEYPFSMIIGDINGLKITNDTFGHAAGDEIICAIANVLKDTCSGDNMTSRWGGDEFAIILSNSDDEIAEEVCNRIREKCTVESKGLIALNISLGYSTIMDSSKKIQDVIKEAEERMYRNKLFESKSARNSIISSLQRALVEKSNETEEHTNRIYERCIKVGKKMNMSKAKVDELELLAFLHDIGKIGISDYILNKPDILTPDEWEIMKTHTEIGYRIASATHELSHIAYAILTHHEHYNGSGYPKGLKSIEIPIASRIISILDAYDVMTHERPYKKAMTVQAALGELRRCSGTQFDPELIEICIDVLQEDLM